MTRAKCKAPEKPKPCPYCGKRVRVQDGKFPGILRFAVGHDSLCSKSHSVFVYGSDRDKTVKRWNRRCKP